MIFRVYWRRSGWHVHCRVFCGPHEGALGKAGDLTMRISEFAEFVEVAWFIEFRNEGDKDEDALEDPRPARDR